MVGTLGLIRDILTYGVQGLAGDTLSPIKDENYGLPRSRFAVRRANTRTGLVRLYPGWGSRRRRIQTTAGYPTDVRSLAASHLRPTGSGVG